MSIFNRYKEFTLGIRPDKDAILWKYLPEKLPSKFTANIANNDVKIILSKTFGSFVPINTDDRIDYDASHDVIYAIDLAPHVLPWGVGDGYYSLNEHRYRVRANGNYTIKITNIYDFLRWTSAIQFNDILTSQDVKKHMKNVILPAINAVLSDKLSTGTYTIENQNTINAELKHSANKALASFSGNCGIEITELFVNFAESVVINT